MVSLYGGRRRDLNPRYPFWGIHDFNRARWPATRLLHQLRLVVQPGYNTAFLLVCQRSFSTFQRYFFGGISGGKGPPGRGLRPWSRARWGPSRKAPASNNPWGHARGRPDSTRRPADWKKIAPEAATGPEGQKLESAFPGRSRYRARNRHTTMPATHRSPELPDEGVV